jgi:hypothetical protein
MQVKQATPKVDAARTKRLGTLLLAECVFGSNLNDTHFILPTVRDVRCTSFDFVAHCEFDRLRNNPSRKQSSRSSG